MNIMLLSKQIEIKINCVFVNYFLLFQLSPATAQSEMVHPATTRTVIVGGEKPQSTSKCEQFLLSMRCKSLN